MPGVCARCTARKGIDREGKECYHHRPDNYYRSEIGNGGWSVATKKYCKSYSTHLTHRVYHYVSDKYATWIHQKHLTHIPPTSHPNMFR